MSQRQPLRNDVRSNRGFTLIEVMVTVMMIGLIAAVLAAAITVIFRSEGSAVRVTAESHDTQQGVNYFPLDVQAGPTAIAAYNISAAAPGCASVGSNVLDFTKGSRRVSYRLDVSVSSGRLDRYTCDNTGTVAVPVWTNVTRVNVADTLDVTASPAAFVTLQPAFDGTLQSAELTLAQQGGDAFVIGSPRAEPRDSPGDCETQNPIEPANGFGVFVEGDVLLRAGAVTGWLALGGTLSWESTVTVASGNMSGVTPSYGLYANNIDWVGDGIAPAEILNVGREDAALGTTFVQSGRDVRQTAVSTDNYIHFSASGPGQIAEPAAGQLDIGSEFDELRDCSAQLARAIDLCATSGCAEEIGVTLTGTNVNLCAGGPRAQVLNLPESYLAPGFSFTSSGPGCTGFSQSRPIIINVIDDGDLTVNIDTSDVDWSNVVGDTKNIIFNFPNSENVNINTAFYGQILAPFAHVQTYNNLQGGVIALRWTHHLGTIDSAGDLFDNGINWP